MQDRCDRPGCGIPIGTVRGVAGRSSRAVVKKTSTKLSKVSTQAAPVSAVCASASISLIGCEHVCA